MCGTSSYIPLEVGWGGWVCASSCLRWRGNAWRCVGRSGRRCRRFECCHALKASGQELPNFCCILFSVVVPILRFILMLTLILLLLLSYTFRKRTKMMNIKVKLQRMMKVFSQFRTAKGTVWCKVREFGLSRHTACHGKL